MDCHFHIDHDPVSTAFLCHGEKYQVFVCSKFGNIACSVVITHSLCWNSQQRTFHKALQVSTQMQEVSMFISYLMHMELPKDKAPKQLSTNITIFFQVSSNAAVKLKFSACFMTC